MNSALTANTNRSDRIAYVSSELLPRAALLTRLLVRQLCGELSRTEVCLLSTLSSGPRRITELAQNFDRSRALRLWHGRSDRPSGDGKLRPGGEAQVIVRAPLVGNNDQDIGFGFAKRRC